MKWRLCVTWDESNRFVTNQQSDEWIAPSLEAAMAWIPAVIFEKDVLKVEIVKVPDAES